MPDDRVRFRQQAAVLPLEERHAAVRVFGEELRLSSLTAELRILLECQWNTDLRRREANLVAIAGHLHMVKHGHGQHPSESHRSMRYFAMRRLQTGCPSRATLHAPLGYRSRARRCHRL